MHIAYTHVHYYPLSLRSSLRKFEIANRTVISHYLPRFPSVAANNPKCSKLTDHSKSITRRTFSTRNFLFYERQPDRSPDAIAKETRPSDSDREWPYLMVSSRRSRKFRIDVINFFLRQHERRSSCAFCSPGHAKKIGTMMSTGARAINEAPLQCRYTD